MRIRYVAMLLLCSAVPVMAQTVMTVQISHRQILIEQQEALQARQEERAQRMQERAALRQGQITARQAMASGHELVHDSAAPMRAY